MYRHTGSHPTRSAKHGSARQRSTSTDRDSAGNQNDNGGRFCREQPRGRPASWHPCLSSPGPGSPSGSPAREALRRALNGDDETPNLALAPSGGTSRRSAVAALSAPGVRREAARRRAGFDASKRARDHAVAERHAAAPARRFPGTEAPGRAARRRRSRRCRRVGRKDEASGQIAEAEVWNATTGSRSPVSNSRRPADASRRFNHDFQGAARQRTGLPQDAHRNWRTRSTRASSEFIDRTRGPSTTRCGGPRTTRARRRDEIGLHAGPARRVRSPSARPDSAWTPLFSRRRAATRPACACCARAAPDVKLRDPRRRTPLLRGGVRVGGGLRWFN